MKRLLVLIVFLSGCSGGEFSSGLFRGGETPDAGEHTDSAPFPGSGGAPGTGGVLGKGGAVHATGGTRATGGEAALPDAYAAGGQPGTGGTDADAGSPSAGGALGTGGASTGGSGGVADGGAPIPCDGAGLSLHHTGLGPTWTNCKPTYDASGDACTVWCTVNHCASPNPPPSYCFSETACNERLTVGQTGSGPATVLTGWSSSGDVVRLSDCKVIGMWD